MIKKLQDTQLAKVSGGIFEKMPYVQNRDLTDTGILIGLGGAIGALSCFCVGTVCSQKAAKAGRQGNKSKQSKLSKAALGLNIAAASCAGIALGGSVISKISHNAEEQKFSIEYYGRQYSDPLDIEEKENDAYLNSI